MPDNQFKEMYLSCLDSSVYLSVKLGRLPLTNNNKFINTWEGEKKPLFNYKGNTLKKMVTFKKIVSKLENLSESENRIQDQCCKSFSFTFSSTEDREILEQLHINCRVYGKRSNGATDRREAGGRTVVSMRTDT